MLPPSVAAAAGPGRPSAPPARPPLEVALERVRAADDFPAVSGRLHQLMDLLGDEETSVQRLANFLLQDYSLTLKLLRTANSFRFNRSGTAIVSATHAIVMMGVRTVRDIVSSIVVFEHYQRRSPGMRELLMLSLLTANHARETAQRSGGAESEHVYLLGMFRNLGEVLVASYLPEQYAAVLREIATHKCPPQMACKRILHFTYEQLATEVLRDWHIPTVDRVLSDEPARGKSDPSQTIVSFAHALTAAVYRQDPQQSRQAVGLLLQKYVGLGLAREDVSAVLEASLSATGDTFKQAGVTLNQLQLQHQLAAALVDAPAETPASPSASAPAPARQPAPSGHAALTAVRVALEDHTLDLNKLVLIVLESTLTSGGFDRAALLLSSTTTREVTTRFALGRDSEPLIAGFRFSLGVSGGAPGIALSRGQELIVAREWELLPDEQRLLRSVGAGCIGLFPLTIAGRTIGALYVDTASPRAPAEAALAIARQMRDAIIAGMVRRRS